MRKVAYIFVFLILFLPYISAQKKLSREQLVADADTLYAQMYDIHPNLFAVYPQSEFEKGLGEAKSQFRDSMIFVDFYRLVTPLVVNLGDGHTSVFLPANLIDKHKKIAFPFEIDVDKTTYAISIKENFSESDIPVGANILSINGRSSEELLREFLKYASGENNLFKFERVKWNFRLLPYLIYGDSTFVVKYRDGEKEKTFTVNGITQEQFDTRKKESSKKVKQEVSRNYVLTVDDEINTAIIDFRSFADFDKFSSFLDSTFSLIKEKNIKSLIVDLRQNGGGNSRLGDELFQYISPVPFQQFGMADVKMSPTLKRIFNDTISEPGLKTYKGSLNELVDNEKRFTGNTYLLTSNHTFSSAADFAWTFHHFGMGKIIGEETGGLIVSFGDVAGSKVPNTGIGFGTSWKKFYGYGADDSYMHGVRPDYEVKADRALDYAIDMIKSKK